MSGVLKAVNSLLSRAVGILIFPLCVGCINDFSLNTDAEGIPVVYGIINPQDSIYYIKLTRTFQCNENVIPCSNHPDKLYYKDPNIILEVLTENGKLLNRGELCPIVIKRPAGKEGLFNPAEEVVYAITRDKITIDSWDQKNRILVLKIYTPEYSKLVFSSTTIRAPHQLINPPTREQGTRLDFFSAEQQCITWRGSTSDYYEGSITFHYSDHFADSVSYKSVDFGFQGPAPVNPSNSTSIIEEDITYRIHGELFLQKISDCFKNVPAPQDLIHRKFESLDVAITSATYEYYDYIYSVHYDSDVEIGIRSNIVNGYGIFSTKRIVYSKGNYLNINNLDSLANSPITQWLKFTKWY